MQNDHQKQSSRLGNEVDSKNDEIKRLIDEITNYEKKNQFL